MIIIIFVLLNDLTPNVKAGCPGGVSRCNWIGWKPWSDCSSTCGGGTRYRSRQYCCKSDLASNIVACMNDCGHSGDYFYDNDSERQSCNTHCLNGGQFIFSSKLYGSCNCPDIRYGTCCENECPPIANCKERYCTSLWNTKCRKCYDDKTFFKKTMSDTKCERMCAWNSHFCWPGSCSEDLTRGCACAPGFKKIGTQSETSCQPRTLPSIMTCNTVTVGPNGEKKQALSSTNSTACQYLSDIYGNFQLSTFEFKMVTEYTVDITSYTKPNFIHESNFGVTDTTVNVLKETGTGARSTLSTHKQLIDTSSSVQSIRTKHDEGTISVTSTVNNLLDGQALCLEFEALAGGYLKSKNTISHAISAAVPYQKTRSSRTICYKYDSTPPRHCKESGSCVYDPVQVKNRITREFITMVDFQGWFDPVPSGSSPLHASSIESFQITVNEVPPSPRTLKVDLKKVFTKKVKVDETEMQLNLTSTTPRLYCITLEVKDVADNVRQARRFLLYDNTSSIETNNDEPFLITSATVQSNFTWQTHHHDICLSWKDHFLNRFYLDNSLLNPIEPEPHGLVTGVYEQVDGLLPVSGTPNVYGIVEFMISWSLDNGPTSPETALPNFKNQTYCNNFKVSDGQTYNIFVRSNDIAGNTYIENRTVHIDRSVPHINNIWLMKDGYKTLFVHHKTDLSLMQLQFEALDPHSGIKMIVWAFGISDTGTELLNGTLSTGAINNVSCPLSSDACYCPDVGKCEFFNYTVPLNKLMDINKHVGDHNRNYYFNIKVTNQADLFNIEHVDILVDDSPPEVGVVYEGPEDSNDIDYTSDDTFLVHWHGFIDHESGIKKYRIGLAHRCLGQKELYNFTHVPDIEFYIDVPYTETSVHVPANFTGKRFISMIALNNAMDPSETVCSDGIIKDLSPPEIRNLTVEHGSWSESIVCHEGRAWLFHSSVSKILLHNVSSCNNICGNLRQPNLLASALPTADVNNKDVEISHFMCNRLRKYGNDTIIYLPNDQINLEWNVEEAGSQIDDFFVGFGTDPSEIKIQDIDKFQSTAKRTSFRRRHEGIGSDELFYIFIKAVNKASLESVTVIGPVLIDETPPACKSVPKVEIFGDDIRVGWQNDTFYDIEQTEQINSIFFEIGHDGTSVTPLLEWNLDTSLPCDGFSGGCFKYPVRKLQRNDNDLGLLFHVKMHVYNKAGHTLTVTTNTIKLPSRYPPGHATVLDIDPEHGNDSTDTNVHFTSNKVCLKWNGFKHHENVKLEVGVGSTNTTDDTVPYTTVNISNCYHCIYSSNITFQKTYFALVRASCSGGKTVSASNGVNIIDKQMVMKSLIVRQGENCSMKKELRPILLNLTVSNFSFTFSLDVGKRYKLVRSTNTFDSIYTKDGIIQSEMNNTDELHFVPFTTKPVIYIRSNNSVVNETHNLLLQSCPSRTYTDSSKDVSAHWFYSGNDDYGLKFEIAVVTKNDTRNYSLTHITQYVSAATSRRHVFAELYLPSTQFYSIAVKQCSKSQCIEPVFSEPFSLATSPEVQTIQKSRIEKDDGTACALIVLKWDAFISDSEILFYQWVISQDNTAAHILTEWHTIRDNNSKEYQVHTCIEIPVHLHSTMFVCIRAYNKAGREGMSCQGLDSSSGIYMPDTVYDLDSNSKEWETILKALPSSNIGHLYKRLHNSELDFGNSDTDVVGAVLYATERNVTWYLMLNKQVPERCDTIKDCITSKATNTGFVSFDRNVISFNTIFYICAYSNTTIVEREMFSESLEEINSCSNGFVLDNQAPSPGHIEVHNTKGFLTNVYALEFKWDGFKENIDARKLGYIDRIRSYNYAIGSRPNGEDIRNFTNVGLKQSVAISNVNLPDGSAIYFTVKATDHAGNVATTVSSEFIVDTSVPTTGRIKISSYNEFQDNNMYISNEKITVHLSGFIDDESGIDYFKIGIGSQQYLMDVLPMSIYNDVTIDLDVSGVSLTDGHSYYIAAMAVNQAGLSSELAILKVVADRSPPTGGQVLDGIRKNEKDIDFQNDHRHIRAFWKGFSDSHSGIAYYRAGFGTKPYLDDIEPFVDVGTAADISWSLTFVIGQRYYTTVEACNAASLCIIRTSNGIVIDNSPPIQGLVRIGSDILHRKFQSHTSSVHVRWAGFEDPQSSIGHYEMCIGTSRGNCDIMPPVNCLLQSNTIKTGIILPTETNLYAMVIAFNKVGLNVTQTSDSFRVDATPPMLSIKPKFILENNNIPGKKGQWDNSVLRINWKFDDQESPITRHDVTLFTHHEGHTPVEHLQLGSEDKITINLDGESWLNNGDTYFVVITSCNLAGLCSSARSEDIVIDSTPPHLGGFKPPMQWENLNNTSGKWKSNVTLFWYGFYDQESGVDRYFITVSKTYSGHELTDGITAVITNGSGNEIMHSIPLTESLERDDFLFLTIWAENSVGRNSSVARVSVSVLSSSSSTVKAHQRGTLELQKHSCDIQYCNNDCTCAVIGQPCVNTGSTEPCQEMNASIADKDIPFLEVFNGMNQRDLGITTSSACLAGSWRLNGGSHNLDNITRFEWSMGLQNQPIGEGIFNFNQERPWNDVGLQMQVVHCLPRNKTLIARENYVIYVRTWLSSTSYAVFQSLPIQVDNTPPSIHRGRTIFDSNEQCNEDFDIIDWMDTITACWSKVFLEQQGRIVYYMLSLGTFPYGDDVLERQNVGLNTSFTLSNLSLSHATRYFFTVTAYNNVGLHTSAISDGFLIDMDDPISGVVYNTPMHRNTEFQSSTSSIGISWHGFQDAFSGIEKYYAAVSEMPYVNNSTNFTHVIIRTSYVFRNLQLEHGKTYYGLVKAVDKVGHVSELVASRGIMIDTTPPIGYRCQNFTEIGILFKMKNATDEKKLNLQFNSTFKMLYKLTGKLETTGDSQLNMKFRLGSFQMYLPLVHDHNKDFLIEHFFFASSTGQQNLELEIEDEDKRSFVLVNLTLSKCIQIVEDNNNAIRLRQISRNKILANILVTDEDRSLSKIELGIGTSAGGFQIKPLSKVYHGNNNHLIYTNGSHGSHVFATVVAENKAGLRSVFHSKPIMIDHTPPVIRNLVVSQRNVQRNVSGTLEMFTVINAVWDVVDHESGIKQCYCSIGHKPGLHDVSSSWNAQSLTLCESTLLQLSHGEALHLNVKCVNNVELSKDTFSEPIISSLERPNSFAAELAFVPLNDESSEYISPDEFTHAIQSNKTCLELKWTGFEDLSGIANYEYRLSQYGRGKIMDWTKTERDFVLVDGLDMTDGELNADVRAINSGGLASEPVNASIIIVRKAPRITGQAAKFDRKGKSLHLNWAGIFKAVEGVPLSYSLIVGSRRGYTDILDIGYISSEAYEVPMPESTIITPSLKEIFIRIVCIYATGLRSAYDTSYKIE